MGFASEFGRSFFGSVGSLFVAATLLAAAIVPSMTGYVA